MPCKYVGISGSSQALWRKSGPREVTAENYRANTNSPMTGPSKNTHNHTIPDYINRNKRRRQIQNIVNLLSLVIDKPELFLFS